MSVSDLQRLIVITGVSRGLGNALAAEFAKRGHTVLGCARSEDAMRQARRAHGGPHDFACVDVASDHQVEAWAERLVRAYGPPGLLINNAAVINRNQSLWLIHPEEFSSVIDINIKGVANVIRHFLPTMVERRKGIIVNISSYWGRSADAHVAPYCATKWAIEGLSLALARELPHGMACVPLNPGVIDTDMLRSCFGHEAASYPGPADWARAAAPYILGLGPEHNGQSLTVPGF
jgi:NAD(P)-dependent dehydrogenase (short-subunit alcohol dehydrogenase family)